MRLTRRTFLHGAGAAALGLSLRRLSFSSAQALARDGGFESSSSAAEMARYRSWEDLYRQKWTWDEIAKGTHYVNCWYQRGCNWNVYVKNGLVLREEQSATYAQTNASVPDFNPRGCQKGACYSHRMYEPDRLKYPLKRVGRRGEGKWQRVSWDEALTDIAESVIEVLRSEGPGAIYWDLGTAGTGGCGGMGAFRSTWILDTPFLDVNAEIGDHHPGAATTFGKIAFASSADDWFQADVILIWGGNPVYTQIPNAHFFTEARYRGARVIAIAPDYNASSIHSDLWVPVNVGTDAAFALSLAHVIVEEKLYDEAFVAEQTDLPLLVRTDTRKFLRESDVTEGGEEDVFYVYDLAARAARPAPKKSLRLEGRKPALEGEFTVRTLAGEIKVTPVFARLREKLREYAPETASRITGTGPNQLRDLAREIAAAKSVTILTQSNFSKYYHGLEMERAQALVLTLCGHIGKKGSGLSAFPYLSMDSPEMMGGARPWPMKLAWLGVAAENAPKWIQGKWKGLTTEMFVYEEARNLYAKGKFVSSVLFFYRYGGLKEIYGHSRAGDPHLTRDIDAYVNESVEKGWQLAPTTEPRIFFEDGGNVLRRVRGYDKVAEHLLPKLKLLVTIDWRLNNTGLHSDYVLPAAGWYEKDDVTWATPIAPFAHATTKAVDPLGESKNDWELHCLLLKKVQELAERKGITMFRGRSGDERRLDRVYDDLTFGRRFMEGDSEKVLAELVRLSLNLKGTTWGQLKEKGYARFSSLGMGALNIGNATDIETNEPITPNRWHTEQKLPWPTLTRRIQFYIDQELYFELGEELPVHKDNPKIGGDYPLLMTGAHTRWSIHSIWRPDSRMLRLQRGEPMLYMSPKDAGPRRLEDGDWVRVHNDVGSFEVRVKLAPTLRPGQLLIYHAWEPFQFRGGRSHQVAIPSPINPIQLAGGYFHLRPTPFSGEPGQNDRGTRVEVEKI